MKSTFFSTLLLLAFTLASTATASSPHMAAARRRHHARKAATAAVSAAEALNKPDAGTPATDFAADESLPAAKLAAAALKLKKGAKTYAISAGSKTHSTIYTDWNTGKNGSAIVFTADMDVDCDGIDYKCKGNPDGQGQTDYGALAAYEVPFIVIPEGYVNANEKLLPGNNVVAVICDGKMYYGIFGDTNGDSPEVIGEASWRMAQTCFPNGKINGNNGHGAADVTYIVFTGKDAVLGKEALTSNYITSFQTLKSMGNEFVGALAKNIGLSSGSSSEPAPAEPSATGTKKSSSGKETATPTKTASEKKATETAKGGVGELANGSSGGKTNPAGSCSN